MFADKLNFLMSIIGISGGELAHAVSLDPSYISRLRSGKRELPKEKHFLNDIALYFATHIRTDYQVKLLCEAMNHEDEWPREIEEAKHRIQDWLTLQEGAQREKIKGVLQGVVSAFLVDAVLSPDCDPDLSQLEKDVGEYYYGDAGKQEAFLRFLQLALCVEDKAELLMFTNESMNWLADDPEYARKTKALLTGFARAGNEIRIVHPIRQDVSEMIFTLERWIPVYMTGYVEPYYYPKVRNNFCLRTTFVVPGVAALISCSLEGNPAEALTLVLTEPRAVAASAAEMEYLISLSKPLAQVYSARHKQDVWKTLAAFFAVPAPTIVIHDHLTPFAVLDEFLEGAKDRGGKALGRDSVEQLIRRNPYTEMVSSPDMDKILAGEVPIQLTHLLADGPKYLSTEAYLENLDDVIRMAEEHSNYNIMIVPQAFFDIYLCVKKGVGVLVSKADKGATTFYIQQSDMVEAVWEYVNTLMTQTKTPNKKVLVKELRELAKAIRR